MLTQWVVELYSDKENVSTIDWNLTDFLDTTCLLIGQNEHISGGIAVEQVAGCGAHSFFEGSSV